MSLARRPLLLQVRDGRSQRGLVVEGPPQDDWAAPGVGGPEMHYWAGVCFYTYPVNRFLEHARRFLQQHVGSRLTKSLPSTSAPC